MRLIVTAVVLLSALGLSACNSCYRMFWQSCGQETPVPAPPGDKAPKLPETRKAPRSTTISPDPDSLTPQMRHVLQALVLAQDTAYFRARSYQHDLAQIPSVVIPKGMRVRIHAADARGWSASAEHDRLPGRSCVVWLGSDAFPPPLVTLWERRPAKSYPRKVLCDGDPPLPVKTPFR